MRPVCIFGLLHHSHAAFAKLHLDVIVRDGATNHVRKQNAWGGEIVGIAVKGSRAGPQLVFYGKFEGGIRIQALENARKPAAPADPTHVSFRGMRVFPAGV
jgi:hypothetical protein